MQTTLFARAVLTLGIAGLSLASLAVPQAGAEDGCPMTTEKFRAKSESDGAEAPALHRRAAIARDSQGVACDPLRGEFPRAGEGAAAPAPATATHVASTPHVVDPKRPLRGDFPIASDQLPSAVAATE